MTLLLGLSVVLLAGTEGYGGMVAPVPIPRPDPSVGTLQRDIVVYGASASGVMAAVAAKQEGASVALVEPTSTIGGMVTSGISATDIGSKSSLGGLPLELYRRAASHYGLQAFGVTIAWQLEAHVAAAALADMLSEAGVEVFLGQRLVRPGGVEMTAGRITALRTESGARFAGTVFIDSTYEGDLLAEAGARFDVGREAATDSGESLAGVTADHLLTPRVSAYQAGHPDRLVAGIGTAPGAVGTGDDRIQPYNFRLCFSSDPANQVPFPKPEGYDRSRYQLLQRILDKLATRASGVHLDDVLTLTPIPNAKVDVNAASVASTDLLGGSWAYPNASYQLRAEIWRDHFNYQAGLLFYLENDKSVPVSVRVEMQAWGLCRDEWHETGSWPPLLYIREARRLVGDYVLTQPDVLTAPPQLDSIGIASYRVDAHAAGLFTREDGLVHVEGALFARLAGPYQIPYRVMLPRREDVTNLLVTVAVSASHVAFASLRMEPHFMAMGEAAGVAAAVARQDSRSVHTVDVASLQARLRARGAILDPPD